MLKVHAGIPASKSQDAHLRANGPEEERVHTPTHVYAFENTSTTACTQIHK